MVVVSMAVVWEAVVMTEAIVVGTEATEEAEVGVTEDRVVLAGEVDMTWGNIYPHNSIHPQGHMAVLPWIGTLCLIFICHNYCEGIWLSQ